MEFPVLIHGAMDYIPSIISSLIIDDDHVIVWTRFINVLAISICWILWLDIARSILQKNSGKYILLTMFVILFVWAASVAGKDPVLKQQSFIGTRDLFLMTSIWLTTRSFISYRKINTYFLLFLAGMFSGIALFWSYDRGVIAAAWIISISISFIFQRKFKNAFLLIIGYLISVTIADKIGIFGSFAENIINITYWIKNTSDVWHLSFNKTFLALPGLVVMTSFSIYVIILSVYNLYYKKMMDIAPVNIGLIIIQLIFLRKYFAVLGFPTGWSFSWPSILLFILNVNINNTLSILNSSIRRCIDNLNLNWMASRKSNLLFALSFSSILILLFSNSIITGLIVVKSLIMPIADEKLIDKAHYGLSDINADEFPCIFQWTNEGVYSLALKKPFCYNYTYAVYISKNSENDVLHRMKLHPPKLIVYDSPYGSVSIRGRHMSDRLPGINKFIEDNYDFKKINSGYVFATLKNN